MSKFTPDKLMIEGPCQGFSAVLCLTPNGEHSVTFFHELSEANNYARMEVRYGAQNRCFVLQASGAYYIGELSAKEVAPALTPRKETT